MTSREKQFINTEKFLAILLTFAGIILLFIAMLTAPIGEINTSVLIGFGEIMTFVGALLGIDYSYKKVLHKIKQGKDETDVKKNSI